MRAFLRICALLGLWVSTASARPPPNADLSLAPWFQSLRQPRTGESCCSIADCRQTDFRVQDGHYEALIEGEWRAIPPEVILQRMDNPTGRAVVCYTPYRGVMCFIKGPET
ncbi:MAG: hypothetical protein JO227_03465 [Acetobacteraceae bacterium]|nr:hypothetical protein [Acetobacteraceae bacterium]